MQPAGYEQRTVSNVAVGLASIPDKSNYALITCSGAAVRWRDDGVDPTAGTGHPLAVGEHLEYSNRADALRFIRSTGSDGTLDVSYYK